MTTCPVEQVTHGRSRTAWGQITELAVEMGRNCPNRQLQWRLLPLPLGL